MYIYIYIYIYIYGCMFMCVSVCICAGFPTGVANMGAPQNLMGGSLSQNMEGAKIPVKEFI